LKERVAIDGGSFENTLHGQSIKGNSMSAISLNRAGPSDNKEHSRAPDVISNDLTGANPMLHATASLC